MNVLDRSIADLDDDARVLESLVNLLKSSGRSAASYEFAEQFLTLGAPSRTSYIIMDQGRRGGGPPDGKA
jgi:FixJ family two-component response regulator